MAVQCGCQTVKGGAVLWATTVRDFIMLQSYVVCVAGIAKQAGRHACLACSVHVS